VLVWKMQLVCGRFFFSRMRGTSRDYLKGVGAAKRKSRLHAGPPGQCFGNCLMRWFADGFFLSHGGNLSGYLKGLGKATYDGGRSEAPPRRPATQKPLVAPAS
jgi:hypothetical protein